MTGGTHTTNPGMLRCSGCCNSLRPIWPETPTTGESPYAIDNKWKLGPKNGWQIDNFDSMTRMQDLRARIKNEKHVWCGFFFYFCDGLFTVKEAKQATLQLPRSFFHRRSF